MIGGVVGGTIGYMEDHMPASTRMVLARAPDRASEPYCFDFDFDASQITADPEGSGFRNLREGDRVPHLLD